MEENKEKKNQFSRADTTLMGNTDVSYEISASSANFDFLLGTKEIINFNFNQEEGQIEVSFRQPSNISYPNGSQSPDKVWKEIYGVKDSKLQLLETISGKHNPGYYVEETIQFDEKEKAKD